MQLTGQTQGEPWQEKVSQIRIYSGARFQPADRADTGTVCAVTGLTHTLSRPGTRSRPRRRAAALEPVLTYRVVPPAGCDHHTLLRSLRLIEEEDPLLRVLVERGTGRDPRAAHGPGAARGAVPPAVRTVRAGRHLDQGNIVYKETIAAPVIGIGHFEPLRHYAEVHLLLEPAARGSGITLDTRCPADRLDPSYQRLVLTHLAERSHPGVLTGAPLTDVKITLLAGRAHVKHTEGGDFRQATYRAVRQGLMGAESVLLEPYYAFTLRVPQAAVGRAMTDLQRLSGTFEPPAMQGEFSILTGEAPVACLRGYAAEVAAYTGGRGQLSCTVAGYRPCHNADEVIAATGYDPTRDVDNPPDSVFCSHGPATSCRGTRCPRTPMSIPA